MHNPKHDKPTKAQRRRKLKVARRKQQTKQWPKKPN